MAATLSFNETAIFVALRGLLLQMLPNGIEIVRAQVNRTAEPHVADFVVMTQIARTRLETNTDTTVDGYPTALGWNFVLQPTQVDIQLDIHGPASGDNVQIVSTLWRDEYSTSYFDATGQDLMALYASDPRQVPFINAEDQWETRWTIDLAMQANQVVQVPQQFADELSAGLIEVDTTYPP